MLGNVTSSLALVVRLAQLQDEPAHMQQ